MAKQSFVTGQVLTAQQVNDLQTNDFNQTVSAKTASYTLVAADKGTRITMSSTSATTITVNTGLFTAGDTLFIQNLNTGVSTITAGTATVNTSSSLALAQYEGGTLYFTSASASIFFKAAGTAAAPAGPTYAIFRDFKSGNASGGTFTSGAWRTRDLNTTVINNITGCSLASNQVTLAAGTYYVNATAPGRTVDNHQTRLYNTTDSAELGFGTDAYIAAGVNASGTSPLQTYFTLAGEKVIELQHRCLTTRADDGFGQNNGFGTETYAVITIVKVA
jgi:hypothetical protein